MQEKSEEQLCQLKNFYEVEKRETGEKNRRRRKRGPKRGIIIWWRTMRSSWERSRIWGRRMLITWRMRWESKKLDEWYYLTIGTRQQSKNKQIENLEKYLQETKDSLNKMQHLSPQFHGVITGQIQWRKKELIAKIDKLTIELTSKERMITTFEN